MQAISTDRQLRRLYFRWERALAEICPETGWRILAAVSGGCDSVVMAALLRESARRELGSIVLAHVNHRLRPEARNEEVFVRRLARSWGVPLHIARVAVQRRARDEGWSLEQAARVERREALRRIARATGCSAIALGHQMNDQAETLLLRILRGVGPRGLGGMAPRSAGEVTLLRPLLDFRHTEIRSFAFRAGLAWIDDPSNDDREIPRNRVRLDLIPQLEQIYNPRLVESLADLARWQRLESEPVAAWARKLCAQALSGSARPRGRITFETARLLEQPPAVASQAIWLAYQRLSGSERALSGRHALEILGGLREIEQRGAGGDREVHLPGRIRLRMAERSVVLEPHQPHPAPAASAEKRARGERTLLAASDPLIRDPHPEPFAAARRVVFGNLEIEIERSCAPPPDLTHGNIAAFDLDALEPPLTVRPWRSGDSLVPFGMRGTKKISDLLGERRLPRAQRAAVRVVADRHGILWVVGHRRADRAPITPETRSILLLRARSAAPAPQESA